MKKYLWFAFASGVLLALLVVYTVVLKASGINTIGGADWPTVRFLCEYYLFRGWRVCGLIFSFTLIIGSVAALSFNKPAVRKILIIFIISLIVSMLLCLVIFPVIVSSIHI